MEHVAKLHMTAADLDRSHLNNLVVEYRCAVEDVMVVTRLRTAMTAYDRYLRKLKGNPKMLYRKVKYSSRVSREDIVF